MKRVLGLSVSIFFTVVLTAGGEPASGSNVNLKASDGTKLAATYYSASDAPGPGILLLHQCNRDRTSWNSLASDLAGKGFHVLTLDYRGYGDSGGIPYTKLTLPELREVGKKWPGDVDIAFAYLLSQPGVRKDAIGAGGASCGVNQSIQLARRHPEVKSLVLLSGNTDRDGRTFLHDSAKLPIFLSAADDDDGAVELMQWLYGLSPNPGTKFEHYKTGGHGTVMFGEHKDLPAMIVNWYVQTLIKTPGSAPAQTGAARASHSPAVLETIDSPGGADKVAQQLADARKRDSKANLFSEQIVNILGYEHMQMGDNKGAVEILKLNV